MMNSLRRLAQHSGRRTFSAQAPLAKHVVAFQRSKLVRDIISIPPDETIKSACVLMDKQNVGAVIVEKAVTHSNVLGILSERDVVRRAASDDDVLKRKVK